MRNGELTTRVCLWRIKKEKDSSMTAKRIRTEPFKDGIERREWLADNVPHFRRNQLGLRDAIATKRVEPFIARYIDQFQIKDALHWAQRKGLFGINTIGHAMERKEA